MSQRDREHIQEYRTPSGELRYRARLWVEGRRRSYSSADLQEVQDWRDEVKKLRSALGKADGAEAERLLSPEQDRTVVEFVLGEWWETQARRTLAEKTRKNYFGAFKRWVVPSPLAAKPATEINAEDIVLWHDWAREKGAPESVLRTAQKVLSSAYSWGAGRPRSRGIRANPVSGARWPKEERTHYVYVVGAEVVGIDTPEVFFGEECGGKKASRQMKKMLDPGDRVKLIRDRSQDNRDRFGWLLRYVERKNRDVGKKQIGKGWAKVFVFERPFKRVEKYRRAQANAKADGRGVWSRCGGDFHQPA